MLCGFVEEQAAAHPVAAALEAGLPESLDAEAAAFCDGIVAALEVHPRGAHGC